MLDPIYLENEKLLIHPFRPEDLNRFGQLIKDIFDILSDEQTLKFLPGKRLNSLEEAELFLQAAILNYHSDRNYIHFITHKELDKVIGMIDLISPEVAKDHYSIDHYPFFIEFYLSGFASSQYIMTEVLPLIVEQVHELGINRIGAVVNRENIAAKKVLEKTNFKFKNKFDVLQDFYEAISPII